MNPLRHTIRDQIVRATGAGEKVGRWTRAPGDDGLFGANAAAKTIHADFPAMMMGGVAALLLQMLHPAALAGVWDHSSFRDDMTGRLKRTARFVAGTTFGGAAEAEALIARVRAIHEGVTGTLPDGTPYRANDPRLLTWVGVTEAWSFLQAHLVYRDPAFPAARQEAYLAEMAELAERLGAKDVPRTRRAVAAYVEAMRPELRCDERTRAIAAALLDQPAAHPLTAPMQAALLTAGVELLPGWAKALHGFRLPPIAGPAIRAGAAGAGAVLRWALAG